MKVCLTWHAFTLLSFQQSYDATSHFESTVDDMLNMYTLITGKDLDLNVDLSAASAADEWDAF